MARAGGTVVLVWCLAAQAAPEMIPADVFAAAASRRAAVEEPLALPLRDGGTFRLADHRGEPVVLAFWASWCAPCRAELPALAEWAQAHRDVAVLAVNVDRTRPAAERFLAAVRFDLPVAFDPDAVQLGKYGVISMPTTFLFDRSGRLAWQHTGYSPQKGFAELDQALAGQR